MTNLNADVIRKTLGDAAATRLEQLDVFAEIESTNSFLMQQAGPAPGKVCVAVTDNQTAGRGQHGRRWQSPPGSGLCLSMAYTFAAVPADLSALTLALGLGVITTLEDLDVAGVQLKWPNDLIVTDGKLGGILTEAQTRPVGAMTVVTGLGLNIELVEPLDLGQDSSWALRAVDMKSRVAELPGWDLLTASLVTGLSETLVNYEAEGFSQYRNQWPENDWLLGREVTVDTSNRQITGIGAGVAHDGALLIDTLNDGTHRVTSGSVVMAGTAGNEL